MTHTVIVPGVGGSEYAHWQSWLQRQLMSCSRVQQSDWNSPILQNWVARICQNSSPDSERYSNCGAQLWLSNHSGSLSIATQNCRRKIKNVVLVAPANPARFGESGFAQHSQSNYSAYFQQLKLAVPTRLLISENDPWLSFADAQALAQAWQLTPINLGQVGHINVASGFGAIS